MPNQKDTEKTNKQGLRRRHRIGLGLILVTVSGFLFWISWPNQVTNVIIVWFFLGLMGLHSLASAWEQTRLGKFFMTLFGLPIAIFLYVAPLFLGVLAAILTCVFLGAIIWLVLDYGYPLILDRPFPKTANAFTTLTLTSVIMTWFGNRLMSKLEKILGKASGYNSQHAVEYLSQERIRVALFVILFVLLVTFTFATYIDTHLTDTPEIEDAILKALVAFVAFDRAYANFKELLRKSPK